MNSMYDSVMRMEGLLGDYEHLIDRLAGYMKEKGIDPAGDNETHPAVMLYGEAGRIYNRLLHTRKEEDLLRMEGELKLMKGMVNEMETGAWAWLTENSFDRKAL